MQIISPRISASHINCCLHGYTTSKPESKERIIERMKLIVPQSKSVPSNKIFHGFYIPLVNNELIISYSSDWKTMAEKSLDTNQQTHPSNSEVHSCNSATSSDHSDAQSHKGKNASYWQTFMKCLTIYIGILTALTLIIGILYVFFRSSLPSWIIVIVTPSNYLGFLNSCGLASALSGFIIVLAHEHPDSVANGNQQLRDALSKESNIAIGDALQLVGLYTALLMDYWFLFPTILAGLIWGVIYCVKFGKSKKDKKQRKTVAKHKRTKSTIMAETASVHATADKVE